LPFGSGKAMGAGANPVVARIIGGWSLSGAYSYASGAPLDWSEAIYFGGDLHFDPRNVNGAFDTSQFVTDSRFQLASHLRTFPTRFGNLRQDGTNNVDLSLLKDTAVKERVKIQFRTDFFNALNHPQFGTPNTAPANSSFGKITAQYNLPRTVQMALKLVW
jgi:hypothetical protein